MRLPEPGQAIGPYTVVRLLASGGMGAVYEARHPQLPRSVALKLLLAPEDPELVARFQREAEACARLNHPNLIRVHESGAVGRACYLVMEFVHGETLQAILGREGPLPSERARSLIAQAAAGIAHAHAAGVLHRDLKPSNLLWDQERGRVCVVDFGLTGRLSAADSLTVTGEVIGTPGYLAPEQTGARDEGTGIQTDVYGLGATLFALLSGGPPFSGRGLAGLAAVANDSAPDLRSLQADVAPDLAALVAQCLEKDPQARPPSVEALLEVLEGRSEAVGRGSRGGRRLVWAALLALALIGAGLAGRAFLGGGPSPGRRSLEGYTAWRAEAGAGFVYGWEAPPPGFQADLEAWASALDADPLPEAEAWQVARRELRAQRRILAARAGADPGLPTAEGLPRGPEDHLAQAVIDLQAGRAAAAEAAFAEVTGSLARSEAAGRTRVALEAARDPRGFLSSLRARKGVEERAAEGLFAGALKRIAPEASREDLLRWHEAARELEWAAAEALRGAIDASAARRLEELAALPFERRRTYLRTLCGPLREAGLWPGAEFQAGCRRQFAAALREHGKLRHGDPARRAEALQLVYLEHELFYRVEPTPCWEPTYLTVLHEPNWNRADAVLERALHRYASHLSGFQLDAKPPPAVASLAQAPEPGSQLERGFRWLAKHDPKLPYTSGACGRAQRELSELLSSGVPDLPPSFSERLFEWMDFLWNARRTAGGRGSRAEVEQLSELARVEFERTLIWAHSYPGQGVDKALARFGIATFWPWTHLSPRAPGLSLGLTRFDDRIRRLEEAEAEARSERPLVKAALGQALGFLVGKLADRAEEGDYVAEVLPRLLVHLERLGRASDQKWEFIRYFQVLLEAHDQERALGFVDRFRLDARAFTPRLALAVGRVLERAGQPERALGGLKRSRGWLVRFKDDPEAPEMRAEVEELIERCSR